MRGRNNPDFYSSHDCHKAARVTRLTRTRASAILIAVATASPAFAADEEAQFWSTQSLALEVADSTHVQFEAVERARSAAFGNEQYQLRAAVEQDVGGGFSLAGGVVYQRSGRQDELRLQQQLTYSNGPLALRTRLEQRFIEDTAHTVWRLRQRVQLTETLDADGDWAAVGNVEGFWTLNRGNPGSQTGLSAVRTQVGVRHKFSSHVSLTLAYVRQQEIRDNAPDRIGHAPLLGLALSF